MILLRALLILATLLGTIAPATAQRPSISAYRLRTEYLVNPVGIDEVRPRLSWVIESQERGQRQTAYRILVARTTKLLAENRGDLWDSGRVNSAESVGIVFSGAPLPSRQQCFWKVLVWDTDSKESTWSAPAQWSMGLLRDTDWTAQWISYKDQSLLHKSQKELFLPPARYYRKPFQVTKPVRRAVLYASALGVFDAYLNGSKISDEMFAPGWSDYHQRVYWRAFDITAQMAKGPNVIGAAVADGWYSGYVGYGMLVGYGPHKSGRAMYGKTPAFLGQLEVEFEDGTRQVVSTDPTWKVTTGPSLEADILMGETYDARLELRGWAQASGDDRTWSQAIRAQDNGSLKAPFFDAAGEREVELGFVRPKRMQAYAAPPVRPIEEIRAIAVTQPAPGVHIFNMGQNFSGVVRLKVRGTAGTRVVLRFGEMLHLNGKLMTENLRKARATDTYILRGDPKGETWTPRFTYHGFQYVEVSGFPGTPGLDAVTGVVVHSDTPLVSSFSSSDQMANQLHRNIIWTQRSNFLEVPTDCPQRDERLGWTGDAQTYARAATYNADTAAFYTKWLDDLKESQRPNGAFPDYAPYPMQHGSKLYSWGTGWMDAGVIVPYAVYKAYGDTRVIDRHYDAMVRFLKFRQSVSPDLRGTKIGNSWGDWLSIVGKTPLEYIDAAYFAHSTQLLAEMAAATNRQTDAERYSALAAQIGEVFQRDYLTADCKLNVDTQTAYALALSYNLIPTGCRQKAADRLALMIRNNGYHMTTGFLGTYPLLPVLSANGHHDLAVRLFQSREFPSWGYEVANGANTIWERWDSFTKEKGIHEPSMNSFSHYAFGAVSEWMFKTLGGIDSDGSGFQKILIRPGPPSPDSNPTTAPIGWVKSSYDSIRGQIVSNWRRDGKQFECEIVIPANTSATVWIPAASATDITEGGQNLTTSKGVRFLRMEGNKAVLAIESGAYRFATRI